jgi:hypothetical protein
MNDKGMFFGAIVLRGQVEGLRVDSVGEWVSIVWVSIV